MNTVSSVENIKNIHVQKNNTADNAPHRHFRVISQVIITFEKITVHLLVIQQAAD